VVNRANGRLRLLRTDDDFLAFYNVLLRAHARHSIRIPGWCLTFNHWHFVVHPRRDGEVSRFFACLGLTHATRWQVAHNAVGMGHLYQGPRWGFFASGSGRLSPRPAPLRPTPTQPSP